MKRTLKFLPLLFISISIISCSSLFGNDDYMPDSEINLHKGSAEQVFEQYENLYPAPFDLDSLSRTDNQLNIDVSYGGGEGGCPPHIFVVQWDSTQPVHPRVDIGLAHFLPVTENCQALVRETLEVDLGELLEDQLSDDLGFRVTNLNDSTFIDLNP